MKTSVPARGTNLNISPMFLHNPLDRIQAESSAFPNTFGCKKRLEDVGLHLVGNSWTVIADLNYNATVVAVDSDAKLAFPVHRVNRVVDNVGPDLVKLASKRIHKEGNPLVIALHHHSLF